MKIKGKLMLFSGVFIIVAIILTLAIFYLFSFYNKNKLITENSLKTLKYMLEARKNEKDFLLTMDLKYQTLNNENVNNINEIRWLSAIINSF